MSLPFYAPNKALQLTASSVRSCVLESKLWCSGAHKSPVWWTVSSTAIFSAPHTQKPNTTINARLAACREVSALCRPHMGSPVLSSVL